MNGAPTVYFPQLIGYTDRKNAYLSQNRRQGAQRTNDEGLTRKQARRLVHKENALLARERDQRTGARGRYVELADALNEAAYEAAHTPLKAAREEMAEQDTAEVAVESLSDVQAKAIEQATGAAIENLRNTRKPAAQVKAEQEEAQREADAYEAAGKRDEFYASFGDAQEASNAERRVCPESYCRAEVPSDPCTTRTGNKAKAPHSKRTIFT